MAWSFVAAETAENTGSTLTIDTPSHVEGDLLVAVVMGRFTISSTGGLFTEATSSAESSSDFSVWYRTATGSEFGSYTFSSSNADLTGAILSYRDVSTTPDTQALQFDTGTGVVCTAPTVTPSAAGSLVIAAYGIEIDGATFTTPSGATARASKAGSGPGIQSSMAVFDYTHGASATGSKTSTASEGSGEDRYGAHVVFGPVGGAQGPTVGFIPI